MVNHLVRFEKSNINIPPNNYESNLILIIARLSCVHNTAWKQQTSYICFNVYFVYHRTCQDKTTAASVVAPTAVNGLTACYYRCYCSCVPLYFATSQHGAEGPALFKNGAPCCNNGYRWQLQIIIVKYITSFLTHCMYLRVRHLLVKAIPVSPCPICQTDKHHDRPVTL